MSSLDIRLVTPRDLPRVPARGSFLSPLSLPTLDLIRASGVTMSCSAPIFTLDLAGAGLTCRAPAW